jgi:hypothetical protein
VDFSVVPTNTSTSRLPRCQVTLPAQNLFKLSARKTDTLLTKTIASIENVDFGDEDVCWR